MNELNDAVREVQICRLCLNLSAANINVFTDDFAKMIEILTTVKITPKDNLPHVSCLKCAREVKSAFLLRRRIIQSHRSLTLKLRNASLENLTDNPENNHGMNSSAVSDRTITSSPSTETPFHHLLQSIITEPSNETRVENEQHQSAVQSSREFEDLESNQIGTEIDESHSEQSDTDDVGEFETEPNGNIANDDILSHEINFNVQPSLSQDQTEKIQNLKLALSRKYSDMINSCKDKIKNFSWKSMNESDRLKFLRWMQRRSTSTHSIRPKTSIKNLPTKRREPLKMYCNICQLKFPNKIKYNNHMSRHRNKVCPVCDKTIRSAYLKKHIALHDATPAMCEVCGITCKNTVSLRMHIFYYHKQGLAICDDCGKTFKTKTKLLYHQRKDHTKERNFKCETCGKGFFTKLYLTKHVNMKHMKLRPHICEYCGKGFSGKHALRTHIRQHTNETPYHCDFCGKSFRQRVSLRGHLKSHHRVEEENTVFCSTCGKGFATDMALDVHMRLHTEIKCPLCSDTFAEKSYLEQHIATSHSNDEEYMVSGQSDIHHWMDM
ncbi:PR domain zinc finger protein 5-like isoform X1 [Euwallacea fornicatus]|uniref:PR domain zinc finger protein 5-like isoform X1 n=1 Tax=Euwallacea fornicatus TaxID=995702 RepID=UPI0033904E8F